MSRTTPRPTTGSSVRRWVTPAVFNAGAALNIVRQPFSASDRTRMIAEVTRSYLPLNITVVELKATPQTTADGRFVAGAASMTDAVNTLRAGDTTSRDAYVFVGTFVAAPGTANQIIYNGSQFGGTSPVSGLDTSDLTSASNLHDDVAIVCDSSGLYNFNTMNNIAHEAGHCFGLQHSLTNSSGNAATDLLHQSEIMSYLNTNTTTSSIAFSRYPVIRGDGNSPGGALVNYNDLEARGGAMTPFDQLAADPNVGANPLFTFVSGTGANDIITITKSGAVANVTVQAFGNAAYTQPITVPGIGGTTYSYTIPLTNTILIYGGGLERPIRHRRQPRRERRDRRYARDRVTARERKRSGRRRLHAEHDRPGGGGQQQLQRDEPGRQFRRPARDRCDHDQLLRFRTRRADRDRQTSPPPASSAVPASIT